MCVFLKLECTFMYSQGISAHEIDVNETRLMDNKMVLPSAKIDRASVSVLGGAALIGTRYTGLYQRQQ